MSIYKTSANILLLIGIVTLLGCDSEYLHDEPDPNYQLTSMEVTPENPSFNDTVKLKVQGEGDRSVVASYNWIIEGSVHSTHGDSLKWFNKEGKSSVEGKVEGKLKDSEYNDFTESLDFKVTFRDRE